MSDIQLFGSPNQVGLAKDLADRIANERNSELDSLINNLRDELRDELCLSEIEGNVKYLRFTGEKK